MQVRQRFNVYCIKTCAMNTGRFILLEKNLCFVPEWACIIDDYNSLHCCFFLKDEQMCRKESKEMTGGVEGQVGLE